MLIRNKIIASFFFLFVATYLVGCTSCSDEKPNTNKPLITLDTIQSFVNSQIGSQEYWRIWNNASDSIDNWKRNNLKSWAGDSTKGEGQLDSTLCINSQQNKVIMANLARELSSAGKLDAILYFYGVKIKGQWYFFSGPTMYIPRDPENLKTPTSFTKLHEIAMDNIFKGYLKKSKESGKWEINEGFFKQLDYSEWGFFDAKGNVVDNSKLTQAQLDSHLLAKAVFSNWKHRDSTNYQPLQ